MFVGLVREAGLNHWGRTTFDVALLFATCTGTFTESSLK